MATALSEQEDAYGREVLALYKGDESFEIIERDDGFFDCTMSPQHYLAPFEDWPTYEQEAIRLARGRVLDIGSGAGRVALYLQEQGHPVLGIDISPLALEVCRMRGVKDVLLAGITDIGPAMGTFDTLVMYGNNFGLMGSFDQARDLLRRFHSLTPPHARILAESNDPYKTRDPAHLAYQAWNRQRNRMPGQLRIRVRFRNYVTPWFDYLIVSRAEMETILAGTGWRIAHCIEATPGSPQESMYVAVLEKEEVPG